MITSIPQYYIVCTYPYCHAWNDNLIIDDNYNIKCTFIVIDNYIQRISDGAYLNEINGNLEFKYDTKTNIEKVYTSVKSNFKFKIGNKFIRHKDYALCLDCDNNTPLFNSDSTFILIENKINVKHDFVIAKYKENIHWTRFLQGNVYIINKSGVDIPKIYDNINIINMNNIGREGHSYLEFIITHYDSLNDRTTFLQADPFFHSPNLLELLTMSDDFDQDHPQNLGLHYSPNRIPGNTICNMYAKLLNGAKYAPYLVLADGNIINFPNDTELNRMFTIFARKNGITRSDIIPHYMRTIGFDKLNYSVFPFVYGALFSVIKNNIIYNDINVYKKALKFLLQSDSQGGIEGYIVERGWLTLLDKQYSH